MAAIVSTGIPARWLQKYNIFKYKRKLDYYFCSINFKLPVSGSISKKKAFAGKGTVSPN